MSIAQKKLFLRTKEVEALFSKLYGEEQVEQEIARYTSVLDGYSANYGDGDIRLFSSPGRTEICGNHTDHNHGKIVGASINLDCIGAAATNTEFKVKIISESFNQNFTVDLTRLSPGTRKSGTEELVKGILKGFLDRGYKIGGFNAYITSNVIASAGVSSSAAFETLICQMINTLFNEGQVDVVTYAHIGKFAENVYWDKASGLLDQMCCAVGGLITIDFKEPTKPRVEKIQYDFSKANHNLIIVQTGRGHADLSADYSSIPNEMKKVAEFFHKETLADIDESRFYDNFMKIRSFAGDRAVLRAIHFFEENKRVEDIVDALRKNDFQRFLSDITRSGNSSWKYLQNTYTNSSPQEQGITVTLALTELFLETKHVGACRVHGGGFAGVIMAMIPAEYVDEYIAYIEGHTQKGAAYKMNIRPLGSICVEEQV